MGVPSSECLKTRENSPQTESELTSLRRSVRRGTPVVRQILGQHRNKTTRPGDYDTANIPAAVELERGSGQNV